MLQSHAFIAAPIAAPLAGPNRFPGQTSKARPMDGQRRRRGQLEAEEAHLQLGTVRDGSETLRNDFVAVTSNRLAAKSKRRFRWVTICVSSKQTPKDDPEMKRLLKSTFKIVAPALAAAALLSSTSYAGAATRYHHQTITIAPKQRVPPRVVVVEPATSGMAMQSTPWHDHAFSLQAREGRRPLAVAQ